MKDKTWTKHGRDITLEQVDNDCKEGGREEGRKKKERIIVCGGLCVCVGVCTLACVVIIVDRTMKVTLNVSNLMYGPSAAFLFIARRL